MGMSKFLKLQQNTTMADGKKSIMNKLIKPFVAVFRKNKKDKVKNQEKDKEKINEVPITKTANEINVNHEIREEAPFDNLLKKLKNLEIEKKARLEDESLGFSNDLDNDSICNLENVVEKDKELLEKFNEVDKKSRLEETTSGLNNDQDDAELFEKFHELVIEKKKENTETEEDDEELNNFSTKIVSEDNRASRIDSQSSEDSGFADGRTLQESDEEKLGKEDTKQKKLQKAYIKRGPIKNNRPMTKQVSSSTQPYEISLPNIHSGGYVITNPEHNVLLPTQPQNLWEQHSFYDEAIDINAFLSEAQIELCLSAIEGVSHTESNSNSNLPLNLPYLEPELAHKNPQVDLHTWLTPPNSVSSIVSKSPQYINIEPSQTNIDTLLGSPDLSSNGDYEEFREIVPLNASPFYPQLGEITYSDTLSPKPTLVASPVYPQTEEITPHDTTSQPVYKTLKHYKDRQKELEAQFSKMECCQNNLIPCKEIFRKKLQNLPEENKKMLCCGVAKLELKYAYGVLLHTLADLSKSDQAEDFKEALFCLVCEKVLSEQKTLFVEEFGLSLLRFAVLRCYQRPVITRYLVQCVRTVTRSAAYQRSSDTVFTEVDSNGDNLLIACVREGDNLANVLRELVRVEQNDIPLFDVHHFNIDGCTALHACCAGHGASTPRAHTLHVLLKHAGADRYRQDHRGGETPLHLAVSSANCQLDMVLIYFNIDRRDWFNLAHSENRSKKSSLEYARNARKLRPTYPREIVDFLERCRKTTKNYLLRK